MDIWRTIAERKIQEAIEAGEFRNLDGRGAPLSLDEDPFVEPSLRMAHRLLKNNGFAPAWIEEGREIDADLDRARRDLRRAGADAAARERFRRVMAELARRITLWNLKTPVPATQKLPPDIEREIARVVSDLRDPA